MQITLHVYKPLCNFSHLHTCWMVHVTFFIKKQTKTNQTKFVLTKQCAQEAGGRKNISFNRDGCKSCT